MSQQAGTVSAGVKKGVVLLILAVAVGFFSLFLIMKEGPRGPKIVGEGDRAPAFHLRALNGAEVSLSDYRGKVVMIHFWATWCPPCIDEIPTIEKLYHAFSGKDFELLAVSLDEGGEEAVNAFLKKNGLTLPVLLDPKRSVSRLYGTFKVPETYVVDREDFVRYKVIGPTDWMSPQNVNIIQAMIDRR